MSQRVAWRIAFPMTGLGVVLLGLGVVAAWNVNHQQQKSSELIARELSAVIAIERLHLEMREVRYQVNLFLRLHEERHLVEAENRHERSSELLTEATSLARSDEEVVLIDRVAKGYRLFFDRFQVLTRQLGVTAQTPADSKKHLEIPAETYAELTRLSDGTLTDDVLKPLEKCILVNQAAVERANAASAVTAQHLRIGFLLLGACGGVAGLLMGIGIARAVRQSIVQLDISVRSMAGRLTELTGPVQFSQVGDLAGLEKGLKKVEDDIVGIVERLQQQESELLRSEQLARVGQLAAGLAHELRNPLMPMKMLVQASLERPDGAGLKGRSLQVINDEIARMEQSIQSFLDFARPPALVKTDVSLQEIVQQAIDLVSARAKSQAVDLCVSFPETEMVMRIDRGQIYQLLLNLLLNALDVLPDGGEVRVTASKHRRARPQAAIAAAPVAATSARNGEADYEFTEHDALRMRYRPPPTPAVVMSEWLCLQVADTGPGIPTDKLTSIFDPFVTTKETGSGLGLTICRRIVTAHQGTISAANLPRKGAEFTVWVPCNGE
ncbi:MAG: ATP-binding protein [Planctomycetaceae bacterium]